MADTDVTPEIVRAMLALHGLQFGPPEIARLTPLVRRQVELVRELQAMDLPDGDPRDMAYIRDLRLPWPSSPG